MPVPWRTTIGSAGCSAACARTSSTIACQDSGVAFEESMSGSSAVSEVEARDSRPGAAGRPGGRRPESHPARSAPGTRPWGESTMPMVPPV